MNAVLLGENDTDFFRAFCTRHYAQQLGKRLYIWFYAVIFHFFQQVLVPTQQKKSKRVNFELINHCTRRY